MWPAVVVSQLDLRQSVVSCGRLHLPPDRIKYFPSSPTRGFAEFLTARARRPLVLSRKLKLNSLIANCKGFEVQELHSVRRIIITCVENLAIRGCCVPVIPGVEAWNQLRSCASDYICMKNWKPKCIKILWIARITSEEKLHLTSNRSEILNTTKKR